MILSQPTKYANANVLIDFADQETRRIKLNSLTCFSLCVLHVAPACAAAAAAACFLWQIWDCDRGLCERSFSRCLCLCSLCFDLLCEEKKWGKIVKFNGITHFKLNLDSKRHKKGKTHRVHTWLAHTRDCNRGSLNRRHQEIYYHRCFVYRVAPNMDYTIVCGSDFVLLNYNALLLPLPTPPQPQPLNHWHFHDGFVPFRHQSIYLNHHVTNYSNGWKTVDAHFCYVLVVQCSVNIHHCSMLTASICIDTVDLNIDTWPT